VQQRLKHSKNNRIKIVAQFIISFDVSILSENKITKMWEIDTVNESHPENAQNVKDTIKTEMADTYELGTYNSNIEPFKSSFSVNQKRINQNVEVKDEDRDTELFEDNANFFHDKCDQTKTEPIGINQYFVKEEMIKCELFENRESEVNQNDEDNDETIESGVVSERTKPAMTFSLTVLENQPGQKATEYENEDLYDISVDNSKSLRDLEETVFGSSVTFDREYLENFNEPEESPCYGYRYSCRKIGKKYIRKTGEDDYLRRYYPWPSSSNFIDGVLQKNKKKR